MLHGCNSIHRSRLEVALAVLSLALPRPLSGTTGQRYRRSLQLLCKGSSQLSCTSHLAALLRGVLRWQRSSLPQCLSSSTWDAWHRRVAPRGRTTQAALLHGRRYVRHLSPSSSGRVGASLPQPKGPQSPSFLSETMEDLYSLFSLAFTTHVARSIGPH
jgi:hypothetical protein